MNGDAWNRFCRSALSCADAFAEALSAAWSWVNAMGAISAATSKVRARHCFLRNLFIIICYLLLLRCCVLLLSLLRQQRRKSLSPRRRRPSIGGTLPTADQCPAARAGRFRAFL